MTPEQVQQLSPEQIQIHIAEARGWVRCCLRYPQSNVFEIWSSPSGIPPEGEGEGVIKDGDREVLPDYPTNLDAMHDVEKPIHAGDEGSWQEYRTRLEEVCAADETCPLHASALHRAKAYLLTLPTLVAALK